MSAHCEARSFTGALSAELGRSGRAGGLSLYWLGQAGFLIRTDHFTLLIDPYLSDSLAEKYRGKPLPHQRMMAPPIAISDLPPIDLVLCTHAHTDHMDPGTLQPLLARQSQTRVISPRARLTDAMTRGGVAEDRVITLDAGESVSPLPGLTLHAVRAAHEALERDEKGCHVFLGYGITYGGITAFHAGDTIPYPGQIEDVRGLNADIALLPVNGRSTALEAQRVPGNFFLAEAIGLTAEAGISAMIAHHFDMFDFNTLPRADIQDAAAQPDLPIRLWPASLGTEYRLTA